MTSALVHRGPDDVGFYHDAHVSLGFRRLAVIDLVTGQQPITAQPGPTTIVLNGEIYNYRALRRDLEQRHPFHTQGDVEVALRLWLDKGVDSLRDLNGMFALAIWDAAQRTLTLARDRFGIKPLYYCWQGKVLAFASEVRALLAGGFPADSTLESSQLLHYLAQGYCAPGASPLTGVASLPPGTLLQVEGAGERRQQRFWQTPRQCRLSLGQARAALEQCLDSAVQRQLVADVPLGLFLSGGLDSSTLTAVARRHLSSRVQTFSVGFDDPEVCNELPIARRVAHHLGTDHHELMMEADQVAADFDAIINALDTPLADPTAIPTWYLSRLTRETVTVALSGEGADEMFGGYRKHRYDLALDAIGAPGRRLLPGLLRCVGRGPSSRLERRLRMSPSLERFLDWSRVLSDDELSRLCGSQQRAIPEEDALQKDWATQLGRDAANARLAADTALFLPGDLLPKVDRMSMAHSLEVRVPYLDNEVADLAMSLPGRCKLRLLRDKIVLREVARPLIPRAVLRRPKQGFDVPIGAWLRGALRPQLLEYLSPSKVNRRGLFSSDTVTSMVEEHLAGRAEHGRSLWALLVLEAWLCQTIDTRVRA